MKTVKRTIKVKPSVERITNGVNSPVRKIVQIAMSNTAIRNGYMEAMIALCDDGTLWQRGVQINDEQAGSSEWFRLNDIPQD